MLNPSIRSRCPRYIASPATAKHIAGIVDAPYGAITAYRNIFKIARHLHPTRDDLQCALDQIGIVGGIRTVDEYTAGGIKTPNQLHVTIGGLGGDIFERPGNMPPCAINAVAGIDSIAAINPSYLAVIGH